VADPVCTCLFGCIVMATTLPMMGENIRILLEGAPDEIDLKKLRSQLER
jgi:Co/Zn/Cd efflux system component